MFISILELFGMNIINDLQFCFNVHICIIRGS